MSADSRTLLIVEDDSPLRERLVRAMRDRGFEALGVADHTAALDAARQDSPELALVDLKLPGESGLKVIRDLKELDPGDSRRRADWLRQHRDGRREHQARRGQLSHQAGRRRSDRGGLRRHAAGSGRRGALAGARRVGTHPTVRDRLRRQRVEGSPLARHPSPIAAAQAVEEPRPSLASRAPEHCGPCPGCFSPRASTGSRSFRSRFTSISWRFTPREHRAFSVPPSTSPRSSVSRCCSRG